MGLLQVIQPRVRAGQVEMLLKKYPTFLKALGLELPHRMVNEISTLVVQSVYSTAPAKWAIFLFNGMNLVLSLMTNLVLGLKTF